MTSSANRRRVFSAAVAALATLSTALVLFVADLSPRVESDFFFSTEDPQMQTSERIGELFPAGDQLLISVTTPDLADRDFLERLRAFSEALQAVPGVGSVHSLTHGPGNPGSVASSPLWSRLLLSDDPRRTLVIAYLDEVAPEASGDAARDLVAAVEAVVSDHERASFALDVSGVPWVVEQIRRALGRDLQVFSAASLLVFALVIAAVYRSPWVIAGTLLTCLAACAVTLAALWAVGAPIGLLTANIVTIVFVLTLSHIVFLTANWSRCAVDGGGEDPVSSGVRLTVPASCGCALTTFLGFSSLLFASAKPLRELGLAGAVGTAVALVLAFGLYPAFLDRARPRVTKTRSRGEFLSRWQVPITAALAVATAVAAVGVPRLITDPHLLSYFEEGGELRRGLERIDRSGGSSPLLLVVREREGAVDAGRLVSAPAQAKMAALQKALETDPEVGTALSLPVLIDEAKRVPMAMFLGTEQLVNILDSAQFDHVAGSFITEDRTRGLYFLRMREVERGEPRRQVIERLQGEVEAADLQLELAGGLYDLQAGLGELVASSVFRGLAGLLALFIVVAAWAARSFRVAAAMIACLAAVPVLVLGLYGHFGLPLDLISSPAANVAIALGIDSMIHLVVAFRRRRRDGQSAPEAWAGARAALWPAVLGAAAILAAGFGIFSLSSFPPTQRFGIAVAVGTAAAAALALVAMPWIAGARAPRPAG
ncbi:MAG: MMPL family transporter [Acidobacteriota bacterium]